MRRREAGFSMVETVIVLGTTTLSILGVVTAHLSCARLNQTNHETMAASESIRGSMEQIASSDLAQVLSLYDGISSNDPAGNGTAPGQSFTSIGLSADSQGRRGSVEMPLNQAGELREDLTIPELGMPRDLNGDGVVDALNHRNDFQIIPVIVRLRWRGISGDREMRLATVLHR